MKKPKILIYDIETAPIKGYVWGLWEQNVGLNQIDTDWHVLSWAAKWLGESKILYQDQRSVKPVTDDKKLLEGIWKLLDEADIVITQNGKAFDQKKLNARFVMSGMKPPSSYKHIDTKQIASRVFGFTSNKLEYLTDKLCKKYKKYKARKYVGFELWRECLAGNMSAWKEMEHYNKLDVLSLEELYKKLIPWDSSVNFALYVDDETKVCSCGSRKFHKNGYAYTSLGKFQRFTCRKCGNESRAHKNEFTKAKTQSLTRRVTK